MSKSGSHKLSSTYIRLRGDASTELLPVDETFWQRIMSGQLGGFRNEFLIASYSFDSDWTTWEMHPHGDEIVFLLSGALSFVLELKDGNQSIDLNEPGAYVIVPKGVWHTARVKTPTRIVAVTPGEGTQHRAATD